MFWRSEQIGESFFEFFPVVAQLQRSFFNLTKPRPKFVRLRLRRLSFWYDALARHFHPNPRYHILTFIAAVQKRIRWTVIKDGY